MHTNLKKFPPLKLNTKKCKEISSEDSKNDKQKKKTGWSNFLSNTQNEMWQQRQFNKNERQKSLYIKVMLFTMIKQIEKYNFYDFNTHTVQ